MSIHIFGGGTVQYVRNHMALCAPAYGDTARYLEKSFAAHHVFVEMHLTRMANPHGSQMETNEDVAQRLEKVLADPHTRAIIFNVALCDYAGQIGDIPSGKYAQRLSSREGLQAMSLTPTEKLLERVKLVRPDIKLVGFKTTAGADLSEQMRLSRRQIEETGADIVFANDTVNRSNFLITASSVSGGSRAHLLDSLVRELKC